MLYRLIIPDDFKEIVRKDLLSYNHCVIKKRPLDEKWSLVFCNGEGIKVLDSWIVKIPQEEVITSDEYVKRLFEDGGNRDFSVRNHFEAGDENGFNRHKLLMKPLLKSIDKVINCNSHDLIVAINRLQTSYTRFCEGRFEECETCRVKPGSPLLCDECLQRRKFHVR